MKFIIKVYKDGKLLAAHITTDDWDFKWLDKNYHKKVDGYIRKGWESAISSSRGIGGFELLYNEKKMKSVYFSCTGDAVTELKDADGKFIHLDEIYTNEDGERYTFHPKPFGASDAFYLRRFETFMRWRDVDMPTQDYIDNLKLHKKED